MNRQTNYAIVENGMRSIIGSTVESVGEQDRVLSIHFSNGAALVLASYWRLSGPSLNTRLSNFDDGQKYGLPAAIDAIVDLSKRITGKPVIESTFNKLTGDLLFAFDDCQVEVFNFSGYEVWKIDFPNGTGQYSNYV